MQDRSEPSVNLLREQIDYYRARAEEYDEWFYRRGRYDRGRGENSTWFRELVTVRRALRSLPTPATILEPACGTGLWTRELLKFGAPITAVDASPEMLAVNRSRIGAEMVEYLQADLFSWQPDRTFDLVFVAFWISHVPPERWAVFLDNLVRWVAPKGWLFFLDSRYDPTSTASNHKLGKPESIIRERKLNDGRSFRIVKVFHDPAPLHHGFLDRGLAGEIRLTDHYFIHGAYQKR